ncbi:MAG: hypothetical protein K9H61_07445 [Bacteroidia bacterium]|nr:hypothetical protein [Bacteroidia bacterium]MCF8426943.1 hypothetical protein [Bacteroidia bacterium]MCF8446815.1 hypothetical protein [Bacteroidia bacterium]
MNAQNWKNKVFGGKNQFEFGNTMVDYFNKDGLSKFRLDQYSKFNLYFGYNRQISNKHSFHFDFINFQSDYDYNKPIGVLVGSFFEQFNIGYSYLIYSKKLDIRPSLSFSYRYFGSELVIFGYRDPVLHEEPLWALLWYNSIGASVGVDINYFFSKHLGLGVKTSYNFYPFENAKLSAGESIDQPDPFLVETHKPLNQMLILNFKIVTRF